MIGSEHVKAARERVAIGYGLPAEVLDAARGPASTLERPEQAELLTIASLGEVYRFRYENAESILAEVDDLLDAGAELSTDAAWLRLNTLGHLASATGRHHDALELHQRARRLAQGEPFNDGEARSLLNIGAAMLTTGDSAGAIETLTAVASHYLAEPDLLSDAQEFLADTLTYSGAHRLAREHYEDALRSSSPLRSRARSRVLRKLTICLLHTGDSTAARRCLESTRGIERTLGLTPGAQSSIDALEIRILAAEGNHERSLELMRDSFGDLARPTDVRSVDSIVLASGESYLALGRHDEIVALWDHTDASSMSAAGASAFASIVGRALELEGRLREAVEIEEAAYSNVRKRSLELAPLLELAGQLEALMALRRRKAEINFAWGWGTELVREVEAVTDLLVGDIVRPLRGLQDHFEHDTGSIVGNAEWYSDTFELVREVEDLLVNGMEQTKLTMTDLEVPATLVIERVCRQLDHEAVQASVKLQRVGSPDDANARWEHSDGLSARVSDAIHRASSGSTVVVAADASVAPPFAVAVR